MPEFELKKQWPIIFAVDTSGSMAGSRLSQLNEALQELTCMLEIVADQMEVGDIQCLSPAKNFSTRIKKKKKKRKNKQWIRFFLTDV